MTGVKSLKAIKIAILLIIPMALFVLPADTFASGTTVCLSKSWFNIECYGCGMTRAVMHLLHFNFETAWFLNKLSYPVVFILGLLWTKLLLGLLGFKILKWL